MRESIRKEVKELDGGTGYSLVLIFGRVNVMDAVRTVRRVSNVPILVIRKRYDGMEKIAVLENGVDEYIQYPARPEEGMASVRALIRRYTEWNPCYAYIGCEPSGEGLCIIPEYRKAKNGVTGVDGKRHIVIVWQGNVCYTPFMGKP